MVMNLMVSDGVNGGHTNGQVASNNITSISKSLSSCLDLKIRFPIFAESVQITASEILSNKKSFFSPEEFCEKVFLTKNEAKSINSLFNNNNNVYLPNSSRRTNYRAK
jgi:serine/threonine protein phosphatase PrpC